MAKPLEELLFDLKGDTDNYTPIDMQERLYLFFSLDFVGSTELKNRDPDWTKLIMSFYRLCGTLLKNEGLTYNTWKYIGDEVLYYKEIRSIETLLNAPAELYTIMKKIQIEFANVNGEYLFLKGALWIGLVIDENNTTSKDAHLMNKKIILKESGVDFIGSDIDEGFRMSKHSLQGMIVMDAKLVYLLRKYENTNTVPNYLNSAVPFKEMIKIPGKVDLKGTWHNRPYPVFWYNENWDSAIENFMYDEQSALYKSLKDNGFKFCDDIDIIQRIYECLSFFKKKVDKIDEVLSQGNSKKTAPQSSYDERVELHCAVICFHKNGEEYKAIKFKRSDAKFYMPNIWEFGCARANAYTNLRDRIIEEYKNDFSIPIKMLDFKNCVNGKVIACENENENSVTPISTYEINKGKNSMQKGLVFIAVTTSKLEEIRCKEDKHSIAEYVSESDLTSINDEEYVPNFKKHLQQAFSLIKLLALTEKGC